MFTKNDLPILIKIIEEEFPCVINVEESEIEVYEDEYENLVEIGIINVDDRKDGVYKLDNNTHNIAQKLKEKGFEVYSNPEFDRRDAFPNGTSYYSVKISFIN